MLRSVLLLRLACTAKPFVAKAEPTDSFQTHAVTKEHKRRIST